MYQRFFRLGNILHPVSWNVHMTGFMLIHTTHILPSYTTFLLPKMNRYLLSASVVSRLIPYHIMDMDGHHASESLLMPTSSRATLSRSQPSSKPRRTISCSLSGAIPLGAGGLLSRFVGKG